MAAKAWLMLAYGDDRAYGGNEGYSDSTDRYSFDSRVPNWKQVTSGDLAVIGGRLRPRGAPEVIGFARVQRVTSSAGSKLVRRCPQCGHPRFKGRSTKQPRWRCDNGHEFDVPVDETVQVQQVVAWFDDTYRPAIGALTAAQAQGGSNQHWGRQLNTSTSSRSRSSVLPLGSNPRRCGRPHWLSGSRGCRAS